MYNHYNGLPGGEADRVAVLRSPYLTIVTQVILNKVSRVECVEVCGAGRSVVAAGVSDPYIDALGRPGIVGVSVLVVVSHEAVSVHRACVRRGAGARWVRPEHAACLRGVTVCNYARVRDVVGACRWASNRGCG
jgi:hypothetical protein